MKRRVLFVGSEDPFQTEIREFMISHGGEAIFASSTAMAIRILDENELDAIVLYIHNLPDAALLKYISDYYPSIQVVVSAGREFESLVNAFRKGRFKMVRDFLDVKKLEEIL